jgi:hypothetical protein
MSKIKETSLQQKIAKIINAEPGYNCLVMPTPRTWEGVYTQKQPVDLIVSKAEKSIRIEMKICNAVNTFNANSIPNHQKIAIVYLLQKNIPVYLLVYMSYHKKLFMVDCKILGKKSCFKIPDMNFFDMSEIVKFVEFIFERL